MKDFVLKGHVCYSKSKNELITQETPMLFASTENPKACFLNCPSNMLSFLSWIMVTISLFPAW